MNFKTLLIAVIFFAEAEMFLLTELTLTTDSSADSLGYASSETTSQDKLDLQARIYLLSDKDTMELGLCES